MIIKKYQKYLVANYFYHFMIVSLVFFSLGFILNFFEELKFFDDHEVASYYPLLLALLNSPSVLFELFPFIFLITTKFFYIYLNDRNEIEILKNNGVNYSKILSILSALSIFIGVLILIIYYTFSSNLKSHYFNLKNNFTEGNDYLAVVNETGLWIKEEIGETINIIHAEKFKDNSIEEITITQTNSRFKMPNTIIAEKANISKKLWKLENVKVINFKGQNNKFSNLNYQSSFNGEIIANLFSNLNSLNLYQLYELSENYKKIGLMNNRLFSNGQIVRSNTDHTGNGFRFNVGYKNEAWWETRFWLGNYDDKFDVNDLGYLRRNNMTWTGLMFKVRRLEPTGTLLGSSLEFKIFNNGLRFPV